MASLKQELLLEELREACSNIGYSVRFERGDFLGGACILRDQRLLIVNKRFSLERKCSTIARALADIGVEDVFLKPAVRSLVDLEKSRSAQ